MSITEIISGVWERHEDEAYRQDQSHWRGVGRWENDGRWKAIGTKTLAGLTNIAAFAGLGPDFWTTKKTVLEWGPGGGANLFALAPFSSTYYGIDISQKNLDEASRMICEEGFKNFSGILVEGEPHTVEASVEVPIDIFLSTAVFQHFPSKDYGAQVLATLYQVTAPGAIGLIQIRYDNGNERFKPISEINDYHKRHITANAYALEEFNDLCAQTGFVPLYICNILSSNNYAYFALRRKR
ncbi:class I SAM-dependent methyltransferase [Roseibium algae]|uniref:Methyltransferase n=1 Tax=Roseibium algae TaxID=3123038 RepID=A0ABU8TS41_9HYPH